MPNAERRRRLAAALLVVVVAEAVVAVAGAIVLGTGFVGARDSFLISNLAVGVPAGLCGALIARHRPGNRLGWLLLAAGVLQAATPAVTPFLLDAMRHDEHGAGVRWLSTVYSGGWPWAIGALLPMVLLHFPDGRLPRPLGRWVPALALANGAVQVLTFSADANPLASVAEVSDRTALSWLHVGAFGSLGVLLATNVVLAGEYLLALGVLARRYRHGTETVRRQLLWLICAVAVAAAVLVVSRLIVPIGSSFPILLTAAIGLVPVAMTVAILRFELLDIRLVWSRTVTYLTLSALTVGCYLGLVAAGQSLLSAELGSVLAALVVALLFHPARVRMQRRVDERLYGARHDPLRALASVVDGLAADAAHPADVLPAIRTALRLPFAELRLGDRAVAVAADGVEPAAVEQVPLVYRGEAVGTLRVGVRLGDARLDPRDRAILELLAVPMAMAIHATTLSIAVQRARLRESIVRRDERQRLRRDVHDGLGPLLTGIAFKTDAARNLSERNAPRARELLDDVRGQVGDALAEVRALLDQLRPAAVEEEGLVAALRRHASSFDRRPDGSDLTVRVAVDGTLPSLAPGVETAAYRIATEAVTNAVRHTRTARVTVALALCDDALVLTIEDDGRSAAEWRPGVGLRSMRERVAEFGGTIEAGATPGGGRVCARIPIDLAS